MEIYVDYYYYYLLFLLLLLLFFIIIIIIIIKTNTIYSNDNHSMNLISKRGWLIIKGTVQQDFRSPAFFIIRISRGH